MLNQDKIRALAESFDEAETTGKKMTEAQAKKFIGEYLLSLGTINRDNQMRNTAFDADVLDRVYKQVQGMRKN